MSGVNFLEKLLDGVEVEWKALRDVAEVRSGWGFPNAYQGQVEGTYPFYKVSDMNTVGNETTMKVANNYIDDSIVKKLGINLAPEGAVIFPKIGAAIATNKKRLLSTTSAYDNNVMGLIPGKNIKFKFLYYWIQTINLSSLANDSGALPSIRKSEMELLPIPIPCPENPKKSLEIQAEIVRILDTMTTHTAELTAELRVRKKQYNYYREQLLSFDAPTTVIPREVAESSEPCDFAQGDGGIAVEWKTLGTLVDINTGSKPPEILESATSFDYINAGTSRSGYSATSNCADDTVTTPSRGQGGIGYVGYQSKPFWLGPLCYKMQSKNLTVLINKYLFYFLQSQSKMLLGLKKEGGVPAVNKSDLIQLEIPVPSLEEQARIVAILDKFDALTNSITEGLPREIELRQKQYEYYRDLLLSFPKPQEA